MLTFKRTQVRSGTRNLLVTSQRLGVSQGFDRAERELDVVIQAQALAPVSVPFGGVSDAPQDHAGHPGGSAFAPAKGDFLQAPPQLAHHALQPAGGARTDHAGLSQNST